MLLTSIVVTTVIAIWSGNIRVRQQHVLFMARIKWCNLMQIHWLIQLWSGSNSIPPDSKATPLTTETPPLECPEEIPQNGINVRWKNSSAADHIKSEPLCYGANGNLITRRCNGTDWFPSLNDLEPCMKVMENFDLSSCPPGYHKISENNTDYCFEIGEPSSWDFPCFKSGGATVITDLSDSELKSFFSYLNSIRSSRYYWLPAQRVKHFNPVVWAIPGPNWGLEVTSNNTLEIQESMLKNCLLLDARNRVIKTENCRNVHPSICFYINEAQYPAQCPEGYYPFRFMLDEGTCYGIEYANNIFGLTFNGFLESKCSQPMGNNDDNGLTRFIFKKMADINKLPDHLWCWFESSYAHNGSHVTPRNQSDNDSNIVTEIMIASLEGDGIDDDETNSLVSAYFELMDIAHKELADIHVTLVNMSSSTYCLPTTTEDIVTLDWELTLIGRITAPKQFCLQSNGLPVKRTCGGSYLLGSIWEPVDGTCSKNYEASNTTNIFV
ncbi:hypothetical protein EVAR_67795_1 [Eumeta japonica]|uniref:Uncharacterized protein n=1 Tax=Eumeta variegata TaxID=151549 RepID=A0A4C2A5H7_EUMVA|nr:hypothetical protein EVAR_67795_1 [Eumeta japonica]